MSLKNLLDAPVTNGNFTFYGFNVYVVSLELSTSVTLKINTAFLTNGVLDTKLLNDGTYNYKSYSLTLKDDDYKNWGSDDGYIITYIKQHFSDVIASPDQRHFGQGQHPVDFASLRQGRGGFQCLGQGQGQGRGGFPGRFGRLGGQIPNI
jgi:hypothetical protein